MASTRTSAVWDTLGECDYCTSVSHRPLGVVLRGPQRTTSRLRHRGCLGLGVATGRSLVFVTGNSGAGKSAVYDELQRRGREAHDTDRDGNAVWVHRQTGAITPAASLSERPPGWIDEQEWCLVTTRVEELAGRADGRTAFLCGAANDIDLLHLFSKVIYLTSTRGPCVAA